MLEEDYDQTQHKLHLFRVTPTREMYFVILQCKRIVFDPILQAAKYCGNEY